MTSYLQYLRHPFSQKPSWQQTRKECKRILEEKKLKWKQRFAHKNEVYITYLNQVNAGAIKIVRMGIN